MLRVCERKNKGSHSHCSNRTASAEGRLTRPDRAQPIRRSEIRALVSAAHDYIGNASVEIGLTAFGFLSGVLLSRALGPEGRGQFTAAMMWPAVVGSLLSFGLQHASAYASGAGWRTARSLHRLAIRYAAYVGLPAAILYWLLCPWLFQRSFGEDIWIPQVFAAGIPLSMYVGMIMPIFQGRGDFRVWNTARIFRGGGWLIAVLILASLGAVTVLRLLIAQTAIVVVTGLYLVVQLRYRRGGASKDEVPMMRLVRYGFAVYLSGLSYLVSQQLDQLLLSLWVAPSELGYYATAASLSMVLLIIPAALGPVAFNKIARSGTSHAEQRQHAWYCLLITTGLLFPAGLLLTLLATSIVNFVYGQAFHRAGELMWVLAPAAVFLGLAQVITEILRGAGRPMLATYAMAVAAVFTAAGLAYALPRYGIWGAAWVSLVAYMLMAAIGARGVWFWARTA